MKHLALIACLAMLTACASTAGTKTNPQLAIWQVEANYEVAAAAAAEYNSLPNCGDPAVLVCSTHAVRVKVKQANDTAQAAVFAAERAVRDPNFSASQTGAVMATAQQAILALTAITATLKLK